MGIELFAWARLLYRNRFAVSLSKLPLVALITAVAAMNTCLRWLETLWYGSAVRKVEIEDDPIFVIGHWRTGTTMLHELLALDPQHRCPSTYESLSPNHFLLSERLVRRFAWWMLPRTRPFDNMRMSFDRPQEDEAALCLRGQPSPFLTVAFPKRPVQDPQYISLDDLSPRQLSGVEVQAPWVSPITALQTGRSLGSEVTAAHLSGAGAQCNVSQSKVCSYRSRPLPSLSVDPSFLENNG